MNAITLVAAKVVVGGSFALGLLLAPHAHAAPDTVNLSDLPIIDSMPVCHMEDGSDVDPSALPCVWTNGGAGAASWLTYEDRSLLIVDDTVR